MKLLINDKEIAHFLVSQLSIDRYAKEIPMCETRTTEVAGWILEKVNREGLKKLDKWRQKAKDKIRKSVENDLREYVNQVKQEIANSRQQNVAIVHKNLEYFVNKFGSDQILKAYKASNKQNFVKSVGQHITKRNVMIRRKDYTDYQENALIRNTVGNEQILIDKIDNSLPFWFIDSGYTNFLESNKKWHRLVPNHLHHGKVFDAPADRLTAFPVFPRPWRSTGDKILIIEPGPFAAGIFHVDINTWKYNVEAELRKYTDKPIVFREKTNKKIRTSLYQHLCDEDYYCTISINSNSATESIWAGVPAITLDRHISNLVTRNKLSDVNNLYRDNLGHWLTMLSYSQFTYDELLDGTAVKIIKKYYV
jgi:hypothetical protein